ncbi:hypothetical protein HPB52_023977 [Rhipicephalus sanguineus]|uniref:Uncharacterized protein n=1 Tax=Rhipicephalus sanguineus TaxID=34632 RepID=A0A9D4T292_RHISA|nr:hypothetical protein HPB52_023977 [Rhipicephalus sanguineus]
MEALFKRRNQVRKAVTQAIASIESLLHVERPSVSDLRNIHRILTDQYELLGGIDNEVEDTVDIDHLEAEMEEADVYVRQIILAKNLVEVSALWMFMPKKTANRAHTFTKGDAFKSTAMEQAPEAPLEDQVQEKTRMIPPGLAWTGHKYR